MGFGDQDHSYPRVLIWAIYRGMSFLDDGLGGQAAVEQREKALGCVQCNSWPDARGVLPLSWLEEATGAMSPDGGSS